MFCTIYPDLTIGERLRKAMRAVDCGRGRSIEHLTRHFGLELSTTMIAETRRTESEE